MKRVERDSITPQKIVDLRRLAGSAASFNLSAATGFPSGFIVEQVEECSVDHQCEQN